MIPIVLCLLALTFDLSATVSHISAARHHRCAISHRGDLWCSGENNLGQLGIGSTTASKKPVHVLSSTSESQLKSVASEQFRTCVTYVDGKARCWGRNSGGVLGSGTNRQTIGTLPEERADLLPPIITQGVEKLELGYFHSCALFKNGYIKCWGRNLYGVLGLGNPNEKLKISDEPSEKIADLPYVDIGTTAKDLCLGAYSSCALTTQNQIKCWGDYSTTGSGATVHVGLAPEHMGENLKPVNLGTEKTIRKLECGQTRHCVLFEDKTVKCWGRNGRSGLVGIGSTEAIIGDHPDELGSALPYVEIGTDLTISDLQCGAFQCCVLIEENRALKCWGENSAGHLLMGTTKNYGTDLSEMGDGLPYSNLGIFAKVKRMFISPFENWVELEQGGFKRWGLFYEDGVFQSVGDTPDEVGVNMPTFNPIGE